MPRQTAQVAEPILGNQLYQQRARQAFPLLVRQAEAGQPISYSALAEEIGIPNPRNLNYPLGSVGNTIERLSKAWKTKIPPLQCLVINQTTGLPGEGFGWFMRDWGDFSSFTRDEQRRIISGAHSAVYAYPRWREVLNAVGLEMPNVDFRVDLSLAGQRHLLAGGGEGDRHRALKLYVAQHPKCIGLSSSKIRGETEAYLLSGDCLDVSFRRRNEWVAVEVKTSMSPDSDIVRGLFQCVKYRSVMDAMQKAEGKLIFSRAILALEEKLPRSLVSLRNTLGIEVCEHIGAGFKWDAKATPRA